MEEKMKKDSTLLVGEDGARYTLHRQPIYDTQVRTSTSTLNNEYKYFSDVQNKSLHITNLEQNGQLAKGYSFQCHGMAIQAINEDAQRPHLAHLLSRNSSLEFKINSKIYLQLPVAVANGGISQTSSQSDPVVAAIFSSQFGAPSCKMNSFGKSPLNIGSQQPFVVTWKTQGLDVASEIAAATPRAENDYYVRLLLLGIMTKPIQ
jgi:hypothetical protein